MNIDTKQALFEICSKYNDVFVVDMYNYIFRFYYANQGLSVTKDGETIPTGHIFGITRQMLFLKEKYPNCAIIFAVDGYDPTRREINSSYKADRVHEIEPRNYVNDILKLCSLIDGVHSVYDARYEADDAIGSVVCTIKKLCENNKIKKRVFILSSDRDMYQLITDEGYCTVNSIKKFGGSDTPTEYINESKVQEAFNGVSPRDLLKFRAITGDASDNLKGYYRYRKANAAIVATNFDYIPDEHKLRLKPGVDMRESWKKFLKTITDDFSVFENNYAIMQLKIFDFEVMPLYKGLEKDKIESILEDAVFYELNMYIRSVGKYSPYSEIVESYNIPVNDDVEDTISQISVDLATLLEQ